MTACSQEALSATQAAHGNLSLQCRLPNRHASPALLIFSKRAQLGKSVGWSGAAHPSCHKGASSADVSAGFVAEYLPSILAARALFRRGVARNPPSPQKLSCAYSCFHTEMQSWTVRPMRSVMRGQGFFCSAGLRAIIVLVSPWVNSLAFIIREHPSNPIPV